MMRRRGLQRSWITKGKGDIAERRLQLEAEALRAAGHRIILEKRPVPMRWDPKEKTWVPAQKSGADFTGHIYRIHTEIEVKQTSGKSDKDAVLNFKSAFGDRAHQLMALDAWRSDECLAFLYWFVDLGFKFRSYLFPIEKVMDLFGKGEKSIDESWARENSTTLEKVCREQKNAQRKVA